MAIYLQSFGQPNEEALRQSLSDDFRWISPQWEAVPYADNAMFDFMQGDNHDLSSPGIFADCTTTSEIEDYPWPDPAQLAVARTLEQLQNAGDVYRASGFWCPFFHDLMNFFGMENYFIKMHTHPDVVHAATRHIIDFYMEANRLFFAQAGGEIDGFFFGNDFGSQRDLLISPSAFNEFIAPYFAELTAQGHAHGYQVILHSCGAVSKVIPDLIAMGVEALHPLQARATGMSAEDLAQYRRQVTFIGGIDTQDLLVNGTPEMVRADVQRVKAVLGERLVVSPSHEALLPNVPPQNLQALVDAALEA